MRKTFLIAILLSFTALNAQYIKPYFNTISVEDGLPEGYIVSSLQDKLGYMWFGTQNGLVRYDGYGLKSYSFPDENGDPLIQYAVQHLHEDKKGKLWVLNRNNGLFYFDRQKDTFLKVKLDETDVNIFRNNYFSKWVEDQKSDIHWILGIDIDTYKPRLYAFHARKNKFEKFEISSNKNRYPRSSENADIIRDAKGKIWVARDSILSFFDLSSKSFKKWFTLPDSLNKTMISGITADPENKDLLWLTTRMPNINPADNPYSRKFFRLNTKTKEFTSFQHIKSDSASIASNCIYIINDSLNRTWFTTDKGISLFNPLTETFTNYHLDLPTTSTGNTTRIEVISVDKAGNLWLGGTFNGLFYLDTHTAKSVMHMHSNAPGSLPDSPRGTNKLFTDQAGTFWVFMPWRGVAYLDHQKSMLNPVPIEPSLGKLNERTSQDDYFINGKFSDSIYFVNNASGLYEWNFKQNSFKKINLKDDALYNQITATYVAHDGLIWIASRNAGLLSYNPLTKSVKKFTNNPTDSLSISSNAISALIGDQEGNLWIGTSDKGLCRFNKKNSTFTSFPFIINNETIKANNELDDQRVISLFFDKEGILWIGTNLGGLNRFDTQTETFTSYLDSKAGFSCVVNIFEDNLNRLWAGTYLSGLYLFDRKTESTIRYSEQNGLLFNAVMGITEDNRSNIWVASVRGLSMINPENNTIINYPTPIGELLSNDILFNGTEGQIEFAVKNGLISFYPEKMIASNSPPSTVIESISYTNANNKDTIVFTDSRKNVELKFNENKISFQYVALHYANSDLNKYAIKLDGFDKDWIQTGSLRFATYTNLSPGKYTFNVKASNSDGVWSESSSSILITISPPWWKTTFAYLFYGILFIAATFFFDRAQRQRILDKQLAKTREKEWEQAKEIEKAYTELKSTQAQLIHSEKMASLGELTAGIAHEIQNPLNFVNNFSEVSVDLLQEMKEEMETGNTEEVKVIAVDLSQNLEKISHHGKRASSIVKGMLEHSRTGDGKKAPTDINAMADEYIRLAYHGIRAKDKSFNADFNIDLDEKLPKINVVGQDIARVMLNLINNAFYAVSEASKKRNQSYKPSVSISTKRLDNKIEIRIADNGNGIPPKILDKIFQPFFTTKSSGEGTGLGLSLSYDIVTKGHGGELTVVTKEGEGSKFTISVPLTKINL